MTRAETVRKFGTEPPKQVEQKVPSSSADNVGAPSKKTRHNTIEGKPPRQHEHKVHTDAQVVWNGHKLEARKIEYSRFRTTRLVNLKIPGQNSNHVGNIRYLLEEEPPHQPTVRRVTMESAGENM